MNPDFRIQKPRTERPLDLARARDGFRFSRCLMKWVFLLAVSASTGSAQSFAILHNFGGRTNDDGAAPAASMVLSGGTLYGTTEAGGVPGYGTVFRVNTDGSEYAVLVHCDFPDAYPQGPVALAGAKLYCATQGGAQQPGPGYPWAEWIESWGTVFSVNTNAENYHRMLEWGAIHYWWGQVTTGPAGGWPQAGLRLSEETLYGTAEGAIFKVDTLGNGYAVLKELNGHSSAEVLVSGNTLFGTTCDGGDNNLGKVFAFDTVSGNYTVLKHFTGADGAAPQASLVLGGTRLYGTTESGGQFGQGTVFSVRTNGADFAVLKHFSGSDGGFPHSQLHLSGDRLFGTTGIGGHFNHGTVFQIQTNGAAFAVLKHFNGDDGDEPYGGLVLGDTTLYGTTADGGMFDEGVIFSLALAPSLYHQAFDGTNHTFSFQTFSNLGYTVQFNDALTTTNWLFYTNLTGNGGMMGFVTRPTDSPRRFFRVRQP